MGYNKIFMDVENRYDKTLERLAKGLDDTMPKTYEVTRLKIEGKSIGEIEEMLKPYGYNFLDDGHIYKKGEKPADYLTGRTCVAHIGSDEHDWGATLYAGKDDQATVHLTNNTRFLFLSDDGKVWLPL